jgi:hypothetical protein
VAALGAALGIWLAPQLLSFALAPSAILLAFLSVLGVVLLMVRIVVLFLLVRGALAARRANRILREVASGSPSIISQDLGFARVNSSSSSDRKAGPSDRNPGRRAGAAFRCMVGS